MTRLKVLCGNVNLRARKNPPNLLTITNETN